MVACGTAIGEKTYYDVAFQKEAKDKVFGLLSMGSSAKEYYALGEEDRIVKEVLKEMDKMFEGKASQNFTGEYLFEDWGRHEFTLGTWTNELPQARLLPALNAPLQGKVYFAGETHNVFNHESTVHGAIMSGYYSIDKLLDSKE